MDTYHPTLIFAIIFVLMLINVFFAMAETALTESHKSRLEKMVDDNVPDAKAALELFEAPELAFVVVQIGITLVSILMGVATSVLLSPVVGEYISFVPYHDTVALVASIVVVTYFTLLLSEFLPSQPSLFPLPMCRRGLEQLEDFFLDRFYLGINLVSATRTAPR